MKIHFVKAGETLFEISMKYGVTVEAIMAANTSVTDPNTIIAGMKLVIPVKQQVHMPVDSAVATATGNTQSPLNLNSPYIPMYPEQVQLQSTPKLTPQSMVHSMPQAPTGVVNQGFSYPGQAVPPFAAIPVPAQPVSASMPTPFSMTSPPPEWNMPTGYTAYNTPYHMTNYSIPQSMPNLPNPNSSPNSAYLGMPQPPTNYQPYSTGMIQYPNNENYEYYNTYSSLQNNTEWPSHNPQPHGQYNQPQLAQDIAMPEQTKQQEGMEQNIGQSDKKRARTSSASKERVAVKLKKNTLHDQVLRLHQTRNKANQR